MIQLRTLKISIYSWKFLLHPMISFTILPLAESPSVSQVISWSVVKWPVCSFVKFNWWPPAVQNQFLVLVHKCMIPNFVLFFFSFHWQYPSPQGHSSSVILHYNPTLYWQYLQPSNHQYISLLHSYFSCQGQEWKYQFKYFHEVQEN